MHKFYTADEIVEENERRNGAEHNVTAPEPGSFEEWALRCVRIKPKGGGPPVPFRLNRPQRKLVAELEKLRLGKEGAIRLILLKARQWGGSTCIQIYMAWLQLAHSTGLNSLIIAHQISASEIIRQMLLRMIDSYNDSLPDDDEGRLTMRKLSRGAIIRIEERDCSITIGTAERPDSSRGGDYNLVHLSEVGLWKQTRGKKPEDIVQSATSGVLFRPNTMIVMESTANGAGTYFHREYLAARDGASQFRALFVPWYEIEAYRLPVEDPHEFARQLLENRDNTESRPREQSGQYLWRLWELGASLEAINWYVNERRKYSEHGAMASEYPSDDVEAFVHSGQRVFDPEALDSMRRELAERENDENLKPSVGDIEAPDEIRRLYHEEITFRPDASGGLEVWDMPDEIRPGKNRYLTVVDVGGRAKRSDWSVITVFDRAGDKPKVAAQWRGHIDHDLLAAKAAAIGAWYFDALLVIESNTLESHDRERDVDGLQAPFILGQLEENYPNLYMRRSPSGQVKPGFHTNVSTKPTVIGILVKYVRDRLYEERDPKAIEELMQYERKPNGTFGAISGCFDDILMTRAIGLYIHEEMDPYIANAPAPRRRPGRAQDAFGIF